MWICPRTSGIEAKADRRRATFLIAFVCPEIKAVCPLFVSPFAPFVERPLETDANALNGIAFNGIGEGGVLAGVTGELNATIVCQVEADGEVLNLKIFRLHGAESLGAHFAFDVQSIIEELGAQGQTDGLFTTQRVLGIIEPHVHRWGNL